MQVRVRWTWSWPALLLGAGLLSCTKAETPASLGGDGVITERPDASAIDRCATPGQVGCPCDETGAVRECGKVIERNGDYVTCSMGKTTCDGATWGTCIGNRIVAQSLSGMALSSSGLKPLSIAAPCTNVCDPNACNSVQNSASDVDAAGLTLTEAGVSLSPGEAGTGGTGPCTGLWCNIASCDGGAKTTVSGIVYDPAGKNPLYNAFVYIPVNATAALPAFTSGASCDTCAGTGNISAIALAQTGADGKFTLNTNVPSGTNIPLIVQMGKWRRKVILPTVTPCANNAIDKSYTRLPKNRFDGNGGTADIPKMAIASGSADPFECLLLKAGIDSSEILVPGGGARIDYYRYNGIDRFPGGAPAGSTLTGSTATLNTYDAVLLPCEGAENAHNTQAPNVVSYTNIGGRVFVTHFGYVWLATPSGGAPQNSTSFYGTANWLNPLNQSVDYNDPMTGNIDTTFPKGQAFAQWLVNVGASTTAGQLTINEPRHNARSAINPPSQRWVYGNSTSSTTTKPDMLLSMTFNTPTTATAANQCGRVVFSDYHVSADALVGASGGSCRDETDCGFTSTCGMPAPVIGTCTTETCGTASDCSDTGASCSGAVTGSCQAATCFRDTDCAKGSCVSGTCRCSKNSHCGSGSTCSSGICSATTCSDSSVCGGSRTCVGSVAGTCTHTCTTDANCTGSGTTCKGGLCLGCLTSNDCPGSSTTCVGGKLGTCSTTSTMFPLTCRNGDLSAQEKALEFMLFDLTACVSPDSWTPPSPTTAYSSYTFTQDFVSACGHGQHVVWREFDWQAQIPSTGSIDFSAQTANASTAWGTAPLVTVAHATSSTSLPSWDAGLLDTKTGGVFAAASPAVVSQNLLRISITLNPTTDKKASPTLTSWKVQYDCADAE